MENTTYRRILSLGTTNEYTTFKRSSFPRPNVVLVRDNGKVYINKAEIRKNEAMPGDIVCYDGQGSIHIFSWQSYNTIPETYTKEAIVVMPSSFRADGKLTCMSLYPVSDQPLSFNWPSSIYDNFIGVGTKENTPNASIVDQDSGRLPIESKKDGTVCRDDNYTRYLSDDDGYCPSPYLVDDTRNTLFNEPHQNHGTYSNVLGLTENDNNPTEVTHGLVTDTRDSAPLAVYSFSSEHIPANSWFIPSMNMLGHMMARLGTIIDSLKNLKDGDDSYVKLLSGESDKPEGTTFLSYNGKNVNGSLFAWTVTAEGFVSSVERNNENKANVIAFTLI